MRCEARRLASAVVSKHIDRLWLEGILAYVLYEKRDHVAIITLNRPERMNALGRELSAELREAEAEFINDDRGVDRHLHRRG